MRKARTRALLFVSFLGAAMVAGCGKCPNRPEASRVLHALDMLLAAPRDEKAAPQRALAEAPCSSPAICEARDLCALAFAHLVEGMQTEQAVKEAIVKIEREGGTREQIDRLEDELTRAERELQAARAGIPECERAASDLRRICGG